jgi:hypothetical protein
MITGRGISLFSTHFVSSLPKKVISEEAARFRCWPWPVRIGNEKVLEAKRKRARIFAILGVIFINSSSVPLPPLTKGPRWLVPT